MNKRKKMSSNNFGFTPVDVQGTQFTWKIENFKCLSRCMNTGQKIMSPTFTVRPDDNLKWQLHLWPNGVNADYQNYVSISLSCSTSTSNCNIHVKFSISILNNKGNKSYEKTARTGSIVNSSSQFYQYLEKELLKCEPSTTLLSEVLTIYCELTVVYKSKLNTIDESIQHQPFFPANEVMNAFEGQLEKQDFSDVTLVASCGKELPAHKFVLAARSPVFSAMFANDMKENKENSVVIKDLDYDSLKEMLRFMYAGKVKNFDNVSGGVLKAQEKYQIDGLKELWEEHFFTNINVDNAVDILALSIRYKIDKIQFLAEKFIRCHAKSIIDGDAFKAIDEPNFLAEIVRILANV